MSAPPVPRRTSPLIVLVHTVTFRQARSFVPIALAIGASAGFRGGTSTIVELVIGVTALSLAEAFLTWWRFSYADGPTSVVVTRGLLARSERTMPNDRVRGVEVEAPALHRVFGLVRVRIDAAAGGTKEKDEELVVDGVRRTEGDRLRTSVLTHRTGVAPSVPGTATGPAAPDEEEFTRFDNRWLLYAPLVGSYLAVPLAAAGALYRVINDVKDNLLPRLAGRYLDDPRSLALLAGVALVLLIPGSIIGAAVVNWGFRLTRRGGSLSVVRGLITRRHVELEIDRIRGATVSAGLGMRWVRAARVTALMTGLRDEGKRGQLLPLGPCSEAWRLAHRLVEDPGPLTAHPRAARRRRLLRAVAPGIAVTLIGLIVTLLAGWWPLLAAGLLLLALGIPAGLGRYAALGSTAGPRSFAVRSGWLVQEHAIVQRRAVVGWRVRQTFFQRRAGLATVIACVGAGSGGYAAIDLGAADVAAFTEAASEPWASALDPRGAALSPGAS